MTLTRPARAGAPASARQHLAELARAAAAPVISAILVTGLLSAWVITGGAGTVTRLQVQVSLAAIPMRAYTLSRARAIHTAPAYLTIRNLGSEPEQLLSVRTPISSHVILTGPPGPGGDRPVTAALAIPAHGSVTLAPFGSDVVLLNPALYETDATVPLTLIFRHAGRVHVTAVVTAPGSP
jgi:copper(I)-binding protein